MGYRVAADIGGTFTDIALLADDGKFATCKVPSTPVAFEQAVIEGIRKLMRSLDLPVSAVAEVLHACTVGTNAVLEQKGAKTAFITTKGYRDLLELRRIRVPRLYDPLYVKPPALVPRNLCFEVEERIDFAGNVLVAVNGKELPGIAQRLKTEHVDAVAVCFLHAYANPQHERHVGAYLREALPGCFITLSCDILPEIREYERASTTVINAYVGPPVKRYISSLSILLKQESISAPLRVMQSSGGILDAHAVLERPAQMIECGPAAGVKAAAFLSGIAGYRKLITFDMGGTTAKASLVEEGEFLIAEEYEVGGGISLSSRLVKGGGYPLKLPAIDISEVGAGGGSIVWVDKAGAIKVGPESAGAVPGPACYGTGNEEPTVTDANVVLGFLNPNALAGGAVKIDSSLSHKAIGTRVAGPLDRSVLDAAYGIHMVANSNMMRAVKSVTTYKGRDPRQFAMLAFGGNGGVHAVELARALRIETVIVPPAAGVFSALGLLFADMELTLTQGFVARTDRVSAGDVEAGFRALEARCSTQMGYDADAVQFRRLVDVRYLGQAFELTVPVRGSTVTDQSLRAAEADFEAEHERNHGHKMTGAAGFELVSLRVVGSVSSSSARERFRGQAIGGSEATAWGSARQVYFGPALGTCETPVLARSALDTVFRQGPLILEEYEGTTVVPPDCGVALDDIGNVVIRLEGAR